MAARTTLTHLRFAPRLSGRTMLRQAWVTAAAMVRARQTRRLLTEMDDRMLADIGIGRGDAQTEASRAFWDLGRRRRQ